eukprot:TRINITY_DN44_c0_g1_i1.p1 TRINITY_DN44_c0_g1~~TRINITY_DN44_c0_g1_i1.p1  ORF type:complete len:493 (+),score=198.67 TRINITY_DN44_c0_g1_i1:26-1480(+)
MEPAFESDEHIFVHEDLSQDLADDQDYSQDDFNNNQQQQQFGDDVMYDNNNNNNNDQGNDGNFNQNINDQAGSFINDQSSNVVGDNNNNDNQNNDAVVDIHDLSEDVSLNAVQVDYFTVDLRKANKVGDGMNAYMSYDIVGTTTLDQYTNQSMEVTRRYRDFNWLHESLLKDHAAYIIPPLPEKQVFSKFVPEFVEYRRRELERFLRRVAAHRVLCKAKSLQVFLEATEEELNAVKNQESSQGGGIASSITGWFGKKISNPFGNAEEVDEWFSAKEQYLGALEIQFTTLTKSTNALAKSHAEMVKVYGALGESAVNVSKCEQDATISDLASSFGRLSELSTQVQLLEKELAEGETIYFEDSLRDYLRYITESKRALTYRLERLAEFQTATRNFTTKQDRYDTVEEAKKTQALEELRAAERTMDDSKKKFDETSSIVRSELELFETMKAADIQATLTLLCQMNMNHELRILDLWKNYLSFLKKDE